MIPYRHLVYSAYLPNLTSYIIIIISRRGKSNIPHLQTTENFFPLSSFLFPLLLAAADC